MPDCHIIIIKGAVQDSSCGRPKNEADIKNYSAKTNTNTEDILANNNEIAGIRESVERLTNDNEKLAKSLDEQIDRNMRETLIFGGVGGTEKTWEETKVKLANTLFSLEEKRIESDNDRFTYYDFYYGIVRAHRGAKERNAKQIYAKFSSQEMVEHIKTLSFVKKDIYINQMRSPMVSERLYNGRMLIKTLKGEDASKQWKMYMNDRCQLMHKKLGADKYIMYKQF